MHEVMFCPFGRHRIGILAHQFNKYDYKTLRSSLGPGGAIALTGAARGIASSAD